MLYITRVATEEDMPRILEIERDAISPPWSHGGLLSEIYKDDSFFALAVENDMILGFIIMRHMDEDSELLQVAVDSAYRRRGIADLLMESALFWACDCGVGIVYLEVRKSNEAAIMLYEKHGFIQSGCRKEYFTDPLEDAIIMFNEV